MLEVNKMYNLNCLKGMKLLDNNSIDCVVTSPPYWQLRDYGFSEQWGLESTYQEYLEHLWQFMDEVYRILKNEGTCWINLGDTYGTISGGIRGLSRDKEYKNHISRKNIIGQGFNQVKPKNMEKCLLLIPHRFAIGCIDRGWILRNTIIWGKRNHMPESVKDRFTKAHEYIFFFVKQKKYYFDLDSIREKIITQNRMGIRTGYESKYNLEEKGNAKSLSQQRQLKRSLGLPEGHELGKNPGDVSDFWDITTKGSKNKHYASYNKKLIIKPILAGCPKNGIVLDPFIGSGTTGLVAKELNRNYIGFEINEEYIKIAEKRINNIMKDLF